MAYFRCGAEAFAFLDRKVAKALAGAGAGTVTGVGAADAAVAVAALTAPVTAPVRSALILASTATLKSSTHVMDANVFVAVTVVYGDALKYSV